MRLASVEIVERIPISVVRVAGEIDMSNVEDMREQLLGAATDASALVVDLSSVAYLDSAGVQLLFDLHRRLEADGQRIVVVVPADSTLSRILEVAKLEAAVGVEPDVPSALRVLDHSRL
jgi:anti-anti-sigma factor